MPTVAINSGIPYGIANKALDRFQEPWGPAITEFRALLGYRLLVPESGIVGNMTIDRIIMELLAFFYGFFKCSLQ
jgi:hypothetical protein